MRVLIDCTQITRVKAGVGMYALNLVQQLAAVKDGMRFWLLVQDDDPDFLLEADNVSIVKVPAKFCRRMAFRFAAEQMYIPLLALRYRIDVVHSLHYSFPLVWMKARKTVTVHDLSSIEMPEVHVDSKRRYYQFFLKASQHRVEEIICDSTSTLEDYLRYFPRDRSSCHVVLLGKSPRFRPDLDASEVDAAIAKYKLKRPYVLYIGMIEPRKNLARLIEAFAAIMDSFPNHQLVVAGKLGWKYAEILEAVKRCHAADRVIFTDYVAEEDKPALICGAEVFAYPSLYEGFGIPVLEGIACGVPTLTSNVSSMPEVAGDACVLVDPTSVEEIREGLKRMLEDGALRAELSRRSLIQAARFDWVETAEGTRAVYRKLFEKK